MKTSLVALLLGFVFASLGISADLSRPNASEGPTELRVAVIVLDITRIDDTTQTFKGNIGLLAQWQDPRLAHSGTSPVRHRLSEIWHPSLEIVNVERERYSLPLEAEVSPSGEVVYRQRLLGTFSQQLDLQDFPFDTQTFAIRFATVGSTTNDIHIIVDEERTAVKSSSWSLSSWRLQDWQIANTPYTLSEQARPLAGLAVELKMQRLVGYFVVKIILPLILIVVMSWTVFWIPPEQASVQISISVTSMLTLIAYRFMVDGLVPRISYLTRMDQFILGATLMVFVTLLLAVATAHLAQSEKREAAKRIDRYSRIAFPVAFLILCSLTLVW